MSTFIPSGMEGGNKTTYTGWEWGWWCGDFGGGGGDCGDGGGDCGDCVVMGIAVVWFITQVSKQGLECGDGVKGK